MKRSGEVELRLEGVDLLQYLPLHHHIQRRGGLIHDQKLGVEGHGDGDHQPLAHAAGELVRVVLEPARVDVDYLQQLLGALDGLVAGHAGVVGQSTSQNCSSMRSTGLSAFMADWNTTLAWRQR